MRALPWGLILPLGFQASFVLAQQIDPCAHDSQTFRCVRFIKNYDADTITVKIPGIHPLLGDKISVRVAHIDTPEIKGQLPCEKEAARTARRLVENQLKHAKRIDLKNVRRDKYFRILADVEIDGHDLKEILLKNRLAYQYEGGTKQKRDWCRWLQSSRVPLNPFPFGEPRRPDESPLPSWAYAPVE
jgi:micrococcal nuclease